MILDFTDDELKAFKALEDGYEKLLKESEGKIKKLRKKDPEPDLETYRKLQDSRPTPPPMPEPIEYRTVDGKDNVPIYSKDDLDAYHNSPEYKAYAKENKRINDAVNKLYDDWYNAGSKEWKQENERYMKLQREYSQAQTDFLTKVEDRQFNALGNDPTAIIEDAFKQSDQIIMNRYYYYEKLRNSGDFSARDVRLQDDGNFKLDTKETRRNILGALDRHLKALPEKEKRELTAYIDRALSTNPFISDEGELGATVSKHDTTEEEKKTGLLVKRPTKYKYPNTKVNHLLFKNELTATDSNYFTPLDLKGDKTIGTYANFVMPNNVIASPVLDPYDKRVHAAIGSCLFAGNHFIPYTMLYSRGMMGLTKSEKNKTVTPDIKRDIKESLSKLLGQVTIDNDPTGELSAKDPNFKRVVIRESILFFQERTEIINGQVTEGIAIPSGYVPVLYRYAESNRNEIVTDPIENIHVDGLNYSRQNLAIMSYTYDRVKEIMYHNDHKNYKKEIPENKRTIRYDTVAKEIGVDFSAMSPTERNRFKKKIDACISSYQLLGYFDRYEHKKDGKTFYAVVLYFEPEPKKLK